MKHLRGLSEIMDSFDVFLLDMWGVLHDGSKPYEGVLETLQHIKRSYPEKRLIILSNSSKRLQDSIQALRKLGFDPNHFDRIITSGELSHTILQSRSFPATQNGRQTHPSESTEPSTTSAVVLGSGDGDEAYCASCQCTVTAVEEASLVLARGTFTIHSGSTVDQRRDKAEYDRALRETLQRAAQRRLPMLVANPDKVRPDADRPPMPGALGDMYEAFLAQSDEEGGQPHELVRRIGKPFPDVYAEALGTTGDVDLSRVIMVGDALETDVAGGSAAGIATLWILLTGIHGPDLPSSVSDDAELQEGAARVLEEFNRRNDTYAKGRKIAPDYIMPTFRW